MADDLLKHLYDIQAAASAILRFVRGKTFDDYEEDELLRSGVERKFEIVGEALNRVRRDTPTILDKIREHRNIVSFRNILAHGYDGIDNSKNRLFTQSRAAPDCQKLTLLRCSGFRQQVSLALGFKRSSRSLKLYGCQEKSEN